MNQQDKSANQQQTEVLIDLEVSTEQAEEAKAGAVVHSSGGGGGAGKVSVHDIS